ncbi:hypothetical protein LAZ67_1001719 [Cordylochernes scorpioides]|uniref:Uncharacterized protein n=1 Tax=Cordylochernes scorpioides TaxID=51811 RepID=A0ABY6JX65_9ARAC|nr:hypothetical protein LAZ67_1001719 [Cordylochernes scorpioides]
MPRHSRRLLGRNTAASRRYRNARDIETPLQSETRRALRRLRYSEARVAATQTMQVPVQRIQLWTHKPFSGLHYAHIDYKADSSVYIGQMSRVCQFCSALRFKDEPFGLCCKQGRVSLPAIESPPEPIFSLLSGQHPLSKSFLLHIRRYNSIFQMTSFGARQVVEQGYMPTFKFQGQVYHVIGSLLPEPDSEQKFLQIYFIDNYGSQTACCTTRQSRPSRARMGSSTAPAVLYGPCTNRLPSFPLHIDHMRGTTFDDEEDLHTWLNNFFDTRSGDLWRNDIIKLVERWEEVVNNNGEYIID